MISELNRLSTSLLYIRVHGYGERFKKIKSLLLHLSMSVGQTMKEMGPANIKINPLGGAVVIGTLLVIFVYAFGFPNLFGGSEERVNMKELLTASVILARRGGDQVRSIRRTDTLQEEVKGKTKEGVPEFVSRGDMESHKAIFYGFAKAFPGLNVCYTPCLSCFIE